MSRVAATFPCNFATDALLNHISFLHDESLLQLSFLEVGVLLKLEEEVVTMAFFMKGQHDILEVVQDRAIFLGNYTSNFSVLDHSLQPEAGNSLWYILDTLDITGLHFKLLVLFILKLFSTVIEGLSEVVHGRKLSV